jgi:hypothetical protein
MNAELEEELGNLKATKKKLLKNHMDMMRNRDRN